LEDLVDSLLNDAHVGHHVRLRHSLRPQELSVSLRITLHDIEYIFNASFDRVHFSLCLAILKAKLFCLHFRFRELFFQLLEQLLPLVIRGGARAPLPINFFLHISNLHLQVFNFIAELIHKLEEGEVLFLGLDEILHQLVDVMNPCGRFDLSERLHVALRLLQAHRRLRLFLLGTPHPSFLEAASLHFVFSLTFVQSHPFQFTLLSLLQPHQILHLPVFLDQIAHLRQLLLIVCLLTVRLLQKHRKLLLSTVSLLISRVSYLNDVGHVLPFIM